MPRPMDISDATFNEVYGGMYHEEDRSQTYYHNGGHHHTNSSGPYIYMPQGHQANPPSQGSVNIGFASGNVNTGPVHGSLHQSEGVRRTAAPQPSHPPPPFLSHASRPALPSRVPRSQPPLSLPPDNFPLHDEPSPSFPEPYMEQERHSNHRDENRANHYENQYAQSSHPRQGRRHREHPHDRPYENTHRDYRPREGRARRAPDQPREDYRGYAPPAHQEHSPPGPHMPPKDNNPFRRMSADAPTTHTSPPPRQPARAYTSDWVAKNASQTYTTAPRKWAGPNLERVEDFENDRESDMPQWSVHSPSEDTGSSSVSSVSPVYWTRTHSSSSATSYSRFSPVQGYGDTLHVDKSKSRSRSSSPGIC